MGERTGVRGPLGADVAVAAGSGVGVDLDVGIAAGKGVGVAADPHPARKRATNSRPHIARYLEVLLKFSAFIYRDSRAVLYMLFLDRMLQRPALSLLNEPLI